MNASHPAHLLVSSLAFVVVAVGIAPLVLALFRLRTQLRDANTRDERRVRLLVQADSENVKLRDDLRAACDNFRKWRDERYNRLLCRSVQVLEEAVKTETRNVQLANEGERLREQVARLHETVARQSRALFRSFVEHGQVEDALERAQARETAVTVALRCAELRVMKARHDAAQALKSLSEANLEVEAANYSAECHRNQASSLERDNQAANREANRAVARACLAENRESAAIREKLQVKDELRRCTDLVVEVSQAHDAQFLRAELAESKLLLAERDVARLNEKLHRALDRPRGAGGRFLPLETKGFDGNDSERL